MRGCCINYEIPNWLGEALAEIVRRRRTAADMLNQTGETHARNVNYAESDRFIQRACKLRYQGGVAGG